MMPREIDTAAKDLVAAINGDDRDACLALCTPDATVADRGTEHDLREWFDTEFFDSKGHLEVDLLGPDGLSLIGNHRNEIREPRRTRWKFTLRGGKISRIDTGPEQ
jgi:hypothetical protein